MEYDRIYGSRATSYGGRSVHIAVQQKKATYNVSHIPEDDKDLARGFLLRANPEIAAHSGVNDVDPGSVLTRAKERIHAAARFERMKQEQGMGKPPRR